MIRLVLVSCAAIAMGAAPALSQTYRPSGAPTGTDAARQRPPAQRPAPAAVPGSRAEQDGAAPAARAAADMPPTDALFDAINRGDMSAAKDAVARGADLHGTNVLGLSPLELAIDLGRNDISFLLLSLRGGEGFSVAGPPKAANAKPTAAEAKAQRDADRQAQREQAAADRRSREVARAAPLASPRSPNLFAGNGGAPVPQAGFLGFDATR